MKKLIVYSLVAAGVLAALSQNAMAVPTRTMPDGGSSALLLTVACSGLMAARRFLKQGK